jgi:uncharacterized protein
MRRAGFWTWFGVLGTLFAVFPALAQTTLPVSPPAVPAPSGAVQPANPVQGDAKGAAESISAEIFGPRRKIDLAYGAFQRGFYLTALALAIERAPNDDAAAQTLIATIYANGLGVAQNMALASSWYAIAAENGDTTAAFQLALMYLNGRGVPKNIERAAELFKQAADAGHREAQYNLALLHIEGTSAEPSFAKAAQLMQKAAEAGLPEARYDYGVMLMQGAGVAPDTRAGVDQIGMAAQMGLAEAQVEYATLLYLGNGVRKDRVEAARWYKKAAEAGNAVAQNRLAKLYAVGENVEQNMATAAMWRALARRQGLIDAGLERLLAQITPEDLSAGETRARFWPGLPPQKLLAPDLVPPSATDEMGRAMDKLVTSLDGSADTIPGN